MTLPILNLINSVQQQQQQDIEITIYKLLMDSIYIQQLTLISVSILGTKSCHISNVLSNCYLRMESMNNDEYIDMTVNDSIITFNNNEYTDIIVTKTDTKFTFNDNNCNQIDVYNSLSINANKNGNSVIINDYVNFTFPCYNESECKNEFNILKCVWLDTSDNDWRNDGCSIVINEVENEIICSCFSNNNRGIFAIIKHNINESCHALKLFLLSSYVLDIFIWILFAIFLIICLYEFVCYVYYQFVFKWTTINICVFGLIGLTSFLYALICLFISCAKYILVTNYNDNNNDSDNINNILE
eukprot:502095_1